MTVQINEQTILIVSVVLSVIALIAITLYLDRKQEEQIKRLKIETYFNYTAIQVICEHLKNEDPVNWLDIWEETQIRIENEN